MSSGTDYYFLPGNRKNELSDALAGAGLHKHPLRQEFTAEDVAVRYTIGFGWSLHLPAHIGDLTLERDRLYTMFTVRGSEEKRATLKDILKEI